MGQDTAAVEPGRRSRVAIAMRVLVAVMLLCVGVSVASAAPPTERAASRVAARWYAAVRRGDVRTATALTALPVSFDVSAGGGAPTPRAPRAPAELRAALPRWRAILGVFPMGVGAVRGWTTDGVGADWREVGVRVVDESFGELHVRVAHGRVVAVRGFWSWGGV